MTTYAFRIRLQDPLPEDDADRVYDAFDEEVSVEEGPKGNYVGFEREARSFLDAVLQSINKIIKLGFEPLAVEDELVSMADIAERIGRTRQSVSMLVSGTRGPGGFPRPVAGNVRSPLWHWADVATWFESATGHETDVEERVRTIASINGALANRVLARERPKDLKRIQRLAG
jgi:hypothetical protein